MVLKKRKLINIGISIVLTGACFFGLVLIQSKINNPNGITNVIVARADIEKGTVITRDNLNSLFKEKSNVDKGVVPDIAIKNKNRLIGMIATNDISKNGIVNESEIKSVNDPIIRVLNPREITIDLKSIGSSVGGTLREGDLVDIFVGNNDLKESTRVLKNVYVNATLTSDGTKIERGQKNPTTIISVIIDEGNVDKLTTAMQMGDIRVSKVN